MKKVALQKPFTEPHFNNNPGRRKETLLFCRHLYMWGCRWGFDDNNGIKSFTSQQHLPGKIPLVLRRFINSVSYLLMTGLKPLYFLYKKLEQLCTDTAGAPSLCSCSVSLLPVAAFISSREWRLSPRGVSAPERRRGSARFRQQVGGMQRPQRPSHR